VALAAWGLFHPEFRPDPGLVDAALRAELAKTGFIAARGVRSARLEQVETVERFRQDLVSHQEIMARDALLTEKRSRRYRKGNASAVLDESTGFTVGPISVVRYWRARPLLIGGFLPYHFWTRYRLLEFSVELNDRFPLAPGGRLVARVASEIRFSDGISAAPDRGQVECRVEELADARTIADRLSGSAAKLYCREQLEHAGISEYRHWYLIDAGWSIPIEGSYPIPFGNEKLPLSWTSRLVAYE